MGIETYIARLCVTSNDPLKILICLIWLTLFMTYSVTYACYRILGFPIWKHYQTAMEDDFSPTLWKPDIFFSLRMTQTLEYRFLDPHCVLPKLELDFWRAPFVQLSDLPLVQNPPCKQTNIWFQSILKIPTFKCSDLGWLVLKWAGP